MLLMKSRIFSVCAWLENRQWWFEQRNFLSHHNMFYNSQNKYKESKSRSLCLFFTFQFNSIYLHFASNSSRKFLTTSLAKLKKNAQNKWQNFFFLQNVRIYILLKSISIAIHLRDLNSKDYYSRIFFIILDLNKNETLIRNTRKTYFF